MRCIVPLPCPPAVDVPPGGLTRVGPRRLLKLDMIASIVRDLVVRELYATIAHLRESPMFLASHLDLGPALAYLLHHSWTYHLFHLPQPLLLRYPLG